MKKIIPQKLKNIYHLGQAVLANFWFGFPSKKISVIGVTGTNGKTTTVQMIVKILEANGKKVAMASTINFQLGENKWINETKFTTLSPWQIQKFLKKAVMDNCQYAVLETSSHALDQNRVWGVRYAMAVITNITREHLDYHLTMENYRVAKRKLFERSEEAVVNLEMDNPQDFLLANNKRKIGYAKKPVNGFSATEKIIAENPAMNLDGSYFQIKDTLFHLPLIGEFNIENALAAIGAGVLAGVSLSTMSRALEKINNIPGRLEFIQNNKNLNILIDYAVTPDSLEKLYQLIDTLNVKKKKIIAVFGACGDRDRGKRPLMGEIVSRYADTIILTDEDPYFEDPNQIISELKSGIKNKAENVDLWIIRDRREAIKKALFVAQEGDFVVVTGKGAETTMAIGRKRLPWSDRKIIEELLK